MVGATYSPRGIYEPSFWTISSTDMRCTPRTSRAATSTATAWIANLAVYVPFVLTTPSTVYEWYLQNSTLTTAHNVDFGIYNLDFSKVQSLGSTVGTTTASVTWNTSTWADLALASGTYYMAFADDSTRNIMTAADVTGYTQSFGVMQQTSAFPLPSPAVPAIYTQTFGVPVFGMNLRSAAI